MKKIIILLFVFVIQTNLHAWRYFPEGTKWTEIRLDTLKYNNWYSKVGDEWVPNFETIEYRVQGEYGKASDNYWNAPYKCVYTNSAEWTDSLTLLISEGEINELPTGVLATVLDVDQPLCPSSYPFEWEIGTMIRFKSILAANATAIFHPGLFDFGVVEEIREGDFGGVRPLKYSDVKGVRMIQGIGVATWNDGECIFGPLKPYDALPMHEERHYRSMLVHFERDGEVLYDVWPEEEKSATVTVNGLDYFLYFNCHEAVLTNGGNCAGELDIPSEVNYNGETYIVKSLLWKAFSGCTELTKVKIPKTVESVMLHYPYLPGEDVEAVLIVCDNPFAGCNALESIEVDEDNPSMKSVAGVLFSKDGTKLYCYPAGCRQESYTIPVGVEWIGEFAFSHNQHITTLTIPNSMKQIYGSFSKCSSLKDVYCYADNVPTTESRAFRDTPIASATLHVPAGSVETYKATSPWKDFGNIVALASPVTFTDGQVATIILPTEPEANKGKYYRLDRMEDGQIIFEQELQPQAHVPYIIVPYEDFSIDLNALDLEGVSSNAVSIEGISFIGSYTRKELDSTEGFYIDIIDTTPDCGFTEETRAFVGALRAYLQVRWDDPYNHGGSRTPEEKMRIVLHDYGTGLEAIQNSQFIIHNDIYDLSGRKVAKGKLPNGIYIEDGKKLLQK